MSSPFELWSLPDRKKKPRVFLVQMPTPTRHLDGIAQPTTVATIPGGMLDAWAMIRQMLAAGGSVTPDDFLAERNVAVLDEEQAIRLLLVLESAEFVRSDERLRAAIESIAEMNPATAVLMVREIACGDEKRAARGRRMLKAYTDES
jgi:hypothetical protein